ncbi:MAG: ATP-binding protein [Legionella sp.]|nr:ATP-binding protein [Legionella sp.]
MMDLNFIVQHSVGNLYWKDRAGRYLGANQAFISLAGLKNSDEIIGKTDRDLFCSVMSDQKLSLLEETDRRIVNSGVGESLKEEGIDANGKPAFYMTRKIPLRNEYGDIMGIMGTSLDVTKEMQADVARSEFLANMRHDIRTPLSGIIGFSELLKSESNEPRIKEYADNLIASSHALRDLMDEVLEAVRVSSGEIPMLKRKFNLVQTLEQIIALYQARAQEKKLNLTLFIGNTLPHFVIGDKIRIHRIALELIGNALNFTDAGHVSIKVDLAKKANRELIIKMTVTDSGIGIPKEKQQEIYLQFKRLTPSYQGIYKGAGLGLYVVKQFIDELEGEIYVSSEPQQGTCFSCLIPLQEPLLDDDSGIDKEEVSVKNEKFYLTPLTALPINSALSDQYALTRILIVEDNLIAQTVTQALVSRLACRVDLASTGHEALVFCDKNHYDLIFMDIGLGEGMDGYEVTHHIRNQAHLRNTPVIALTAHAGDDNKQRCIEAGMDAVLTKPLTQACLADILKAFIPVTNATTEQVRRDLPDQNNELFQLEQFALFDYEQALINCGNNQVMLIEMLALMINKEVPADLKKMKKAFSAQDFPLVEKIAHKIKGGSVYVGTTRMKYACQYVERYWKTGERELFSPLYLQVVSTIEETCIFVARWLKNGAANKD